MSEQMEFRLLRFNPRRAMCGVEAAEVECREAASQCQEFLWMSEKDIANNIREFGPHPELLKAQQHYRTKVEFDIYRVPTEHDSTFRATRDE